MKVAEAAWKAVAEAARDAASSPQESYDVAAGAVVGCEEAAGAGAAWEEAAGAGAGSMGRGSGSGCRILFLPGDGTRGGMGGARVGAGVGGSELAALASWGARGGISWSEAVPQWTFLRERASCG